MQTLDDNINNNLEDRPELLVETEKMFFTLQRNLTLEAQNIIWGFLSLIKGSYPKSQRKKEWNILLENLQLLMSDFENNLSGTSEIRLTGLEHNARDLKSKEDKKF